MSKIVRYQGDVRAFASDAQGMERTVFGGTNQADDLTSQITASFLRGWGIVGASEHPSLEDFNAAMYAMSQFIAYQHQMGVPEWHAEQEYHIGSICTHNGESYQSLQNENIGSQPPSAKWTPVLTSKNGLSNLGLTDLGIGKNIQGANQNLLSDATSSGFYVYNGNTDPDFGIDFGMVLTLLYDSVSKQRVQIYLPLANTAGATPIIRVVNGSTTVWKYKLFSEKYKPTPADVGMGSGAPAIGVPFFWPSAAMPNTVISEWSDMVFLKFNGASFSAAAYPKLAQVLPGLTLPEARGEFPRIWDDGRGVDSGRALLSTQVDAIRNITGEVGFVQYFGNTTNSGALYSGGAQNLTNLQPGGNTVAQSILFSAGKDPSVSIANENRPRNIAFNFLVRAK